MYLISKFNFNRSNYKNTLGRKFVPCPKCKEGKKPNGLVCLNCNGRGKVMGEAVNQQ